MSDVDIVVLWVDGSDKDWQRQRYAYQYGQDQADDFFNRQQGEIRYRDWGLMRYWFRGIAKFAPWVRKIHWVTCGQVPEFLDVSSPRLNLVDHRDYIDEACLPTFNSNVIELNLHKLSGLSERFICFNDDMFLMAPTREEDFFYRGLPCDYAVMGMIKTARIKDIFAHFLLNNSGFLNKHVNKRRSLKNNFFKFFNVVYGEKILKNIFMAPFSDFQDFENPHLPQAFLKSSFQKMWDLEPDYMTAVSRHRFRDYEDVTQYLVRNWQLANGLFHPISPRHRGTMVRLSDDTIDYAISQITNPQTAMLCLNDDVDISDFVSMRSKLIAAFESLLPDKCEFER